MYYGTVNTDTFTEYQHPCLPWLQYNKPKTVVIGSLNPVS